jgi:hypothetical protein
MMTDIDLRYEEEKGRKMGKTRDGSLDRRR